MLALEEATQFDSVSSTFIAILDDDDAWTENHVDLCLRHGIVDSSNVVVSGLVRVADNDQRTPMRNSVVEDVHPARFLVGNPHVQGSNMFIHLNVMLKSGLFDEALRSSTDRDLMIRLLDFGDEFHISCTESHTVLRHVDEGRNRLSSPLSDAKKLGTAAF